MIKYVYKYHKILGLITVIPILFWSLSGLMHPFMAHWFKPEIAHQFIPPKPINTNELNFSLKDVLELNKIDSLLSFRLVSFQEETYYQIELSDKSYAYFSVTSGKHLENGDVIYAEYLARYFLNDDTSDVVKRELQHSFSTQYKFINRLLPVWKIAFNRPDKMDVYVETSSSRLGTYNPQYRKAFLWVFDNFHNWSFITSISDNYIRIIVMILSLSIIFLSALSGIYIYGFMWKKSKGKFQNEEGTRGFFRKYHRKIGFTFALVTLTFAFSGAYHAIMKWEPNVLPESVYKKPIVIQSIQHDFSACVDFNMPFLNANIIQLENQNPLYQLYYFDKQKKKTIKRYYDIQTLREVELADETYALFLASHFWKTSLQRTQSLPKVRSISHVEDFKSKEYGFVFKRLPVVRIDFDNTKNSTLFIETATARLASSINDNDRIEGYSFSFLHKFVFLDWAGKNARDLFLILSALSILIVSLFGLVLFVRK